MKYSKNMILLYREQMRNDNKIYWKLDFMFLDLEGWVGGNVVILMIWQNWHGRCQESHVSNISTCQIAERWLIDVKKNCLKKKRSDLDKIKWLSHCPQNVADLLRSGFIFNLSENCCCYGDWAIVICSWFWSETKTL